MNKDNRKANRTNRETQEMMVAPHRNHISWAMNNTKQWLVAVDRYMTRGYSLEQAIRTADYVICKGE